MTQIKKLAITLTNLGFPSELVRKHTVKFGEMSYLSLSFRLLDKTTIHIEAYSGELDSRFIMVRKVKDPQQTQVLIKGPFTDAILDQVAFEVASLMIVF